MNNKKHTFNSIFNTQFEITEIEEKTKEEIKKAILIDKIVIPKIQRDYAQGRREPESILRTRKKFLEALFQAVEDKPITLDFIYGDIDSDGIMTPLDGQQRLTTLFLLYWYAAKRENVSENDYSFLSKFTYQTRYSARDFCNEICKVEFNPDFSIAISKEIEEQAWFPLNWKNDPTIDSMMVMLDAIQEKFVNVKNLWHKLNNEEKISFYFLPIKDMGLTDDLYIKMNSRGKPLTQFEHFKAEFEKNLREINKTVAERIISKIDREWTDVLWDYRGDDNITDDEFLRYFSFICDIIRYKNNDTPQGKSNDEFDLLEEFFSKKNENTEKNVELLEKYFDVWIEIKKTQTIKDFFENVICQNEHNKNMVKLASTYPNLNLFENCLRDYADVLGNNNRKFPLGRTVIFYAFISYLLNKDIKNITIEQFVRRLRIINNLVQNSENEISDSENRQSGNRMPAILEQVDFIITEGNIALELDNNFNRKQLEEESEKIKWLNTNMDKQDSLFRLEDHDFLYGQISIIGLENWKNFERFEKLFDCDLDLVDCALLATGNYLKSDGNNWRYQLGSSGKNLNSNSTNTAWRTILHSGNSTDATGLTINNLLASSTVFDDSYLQKIIDSYIKKCEENNFYEWRYYYIKYPFFRRGTYGKYYWPNYNDAPYDFYSLWTPRQVSENTYHVFLRGLTENVNKEQYGSRIDLSNNRYIIADNKGYILKNSTDDSEIERLTVNQENGIDREDRIIKGKIWYNKL